MWCLLLYAGTSDDFYGYPSKLIQYDVIDAFEDNFPMGSSGEHQKISAMKVIDQL
jgi:hypothetical protein